MSTSDDRPAGASAAFEDEGRGGAPASFEDEGRGSPAGGTRRKAISGKLRIGKAPGARGKRETEVFDNFDNPVSEDAGAAVAVDGGSETSTEAVQRISSKDSEEQAAAIAALDGERRTGRDRCSYTVLTIGICLLLPFFVAIALLSLWMLWLAPNTMTSLVAMVSVTVPVVLMVGRQGASRSSERLLQAFSFLMTLAISMQLSVCVIFLLDDGTLTTAFIDSCKSTVQEICHSENYNLWEDVLPVSARSLRDACSCADPNSGGGSSMGTTVSDAAAESEGLGFTAAAIAAMVFTLLVEALLSYLAWGMMVDLDVQDAQTLAKQDGGAPIGAIRGEVICGRNLRSKVQNDLSVSKSDGSSQGDDKDLSCRHVVLSIGTPDLDKKHEHRLQKVTTESVDDDPSPEFRHHFHGSSGFTIYESSQTLEVEVWDMIDPKKPVQVGAASVDLECDYESGRLPEQEYLMDGEEGNYVNIWLEWQPEDKDSERVAAGSVRLQLTYIPEPDLLGAATQTVLQSWYFEGTVLFMVALQMIVLAMQCPADPPSIVNFGAVKMLEVFITTHMTIELTMEWLVKASKGQHMLFYHDRWYMLALVVCLCNWLAIAAPDMTWVDVVQAQTRTLAGDSQIEGAITDVTGYEFSDIPNIDVSQIRQIDGSKTWVASRLINAQEHVGLDFAKRVKKTLSVLRVFRAVRPIRTLRMLKHVNIILNVLGESATLFVTVSLMLVFLLAVFALIGMTSFGGALQYECIGEPGSRSKPSCTDEQLYVSQRLEQSACPVPCPPSLKCSEEFEWCAPLRSGRRDIGGDMYGYRDFDNFWKAMVTMFVQMTGDGGMHTIPLALAEAGSTSDTFAWTISFLATLMLNLVSLNLFLALCCSAYSETAVNIEELEAEKEALRATKRAELIAQGVILDEPADKLSAVPYEEAVAAKAWPRGSSRCPPLRSLAHDVVLNKWFERFISVLILANTVVMATYHEDMDQETKDLLHLLETISLLIFATEAVLKVLGIGSTLYWRSAENAFDAFVVVSSMLGFIATYYMDQIHSIFGLRMDLQVVQSLRAFRLLRALQLLRFMSRQKALMDVLKTVFQAWRPLAVHSLFCFFSICMFAVIGMHLMGGSLGPDATLADYDTECNANMESMDRAMFTVFELTVGESWSFSMWWYMRFASLAYGYPEWFVTATFILIYVWMNCILFSLYVAMLLENFSVDEKEKPELQKRMWGRLQRKAKRDGASELTRHLARSKSRGNAHAKIESTYSLLADAAKHTLDLDDRRTKSCGCFRLDSTIRLTAAKIQSSKAFSRTIMFLIGFSCISLALGGPPGADSGVVGGEELKTVLYVTNSLVLFAFIIEATIKCVVHGIWRPSGPTRPYLSWRMNQVDTLIILINLATHLPGVTVDGTFARMMRMGRLVTPILNLTKNPEIKLVFVSFLRAAPDTAIMMVPLALLVLVFSIVGVATFGSVLAGCARIDDPLILLPDDTYPFGNETLCRQSDSYIWTSPSFHFDSTGRAFATLFVAMTDGAKGVTMETTAHNRFTRLYWVLFHLSFTMFFLNLFIGVLSASFEKTSGIALKTIREKQWEAVMNELATFRPVSEAYSEMAPDSESTCCRKWRTPKFWYDFRTTMFQLSTNNKLENVWRIVIIVNVSTLAFESYPAGLQDAWFGITVQDVIKAVNVCCLLLNSAEIMIKLMGFGLINYFSDGWLVTDLLLVVGSAYLMLFGVSSGLEVLRVIRVLRMLVLASKLPSLLSLIDTLVRCVRGSLAMILITSIIVYLFTILGMNLFGSLPSADAVARAGLDQSAELSLRLNGTIIAATCPHCSAYTDRDNFFSFTSGAALLLQSAFGQGIGAFISDAQYLGGSFVITLLFFGVYFVSIVWVAINLLLVTVLSNFEAATTEQHTGNLAITPTDLDGFAYVWASLTVGPQGAHAVEENEVGLLEHLAEVRAEESREQGLNHVDPTTINFEDGDPELCGTLTMYIEELSGLAETLDLRPYCTVQVEGESGTCAHSMFTSTTVAELGTGVASWQKKRKNGTKGKGAKLRCHVTSVQEELNFCVRDSYAFCDGWIGGARVSLDDIRSQPQQTITLKLRANSTIPTETHRGSRADQWQRFERFKETTKKKIVLAQRVIKGFAAFESDPSPIAELGADAQTTGGDGEAVDVESEGSATWPSNASTGDSPETGGDAAGQASQQPDNEEEDDDVDDPAERKRVEKLKRRADKKEAKRLKRAKKAAAKEEKRKAKEAKKAEKLAKKLEKKYSMDVGADPERYKKRNDGSDEAAGEEEPEEENKVPHKFYRPGWEENGVQLKVTFKFQPKLSLVRSTTFMRDYRTRYMHKEIACGIEGWLEFSDRPNGTFKRRFCYLQEFPRPCLKVCTRGADIFDLEKAASSESLKIIEVAGAQMSAIHAEVDGKTFSVRGKTSAEDDSGMEEQQIGQIAGSVLRACNVPVGEESMSSLYCVIGLASQSDAEKQGTLLCRYEGQKTSKALKEEEFQKMDVTVSRSGVLTVAVGALGQVEVDLTGTKTKIGVPKMRRGMKSVDVGQLDASLSLDNVLQVQAGSPVHSFTFQFESEAEKSQWHSVFALAAGLGSETKVQALPTAPIEPVITNERLRTAAAEWSQDFDLNVYPSTRAMTVRIFEGKPSSKGVMGRDSPRLGSRSTELGSAEITVAHAVHVGDFGPTLSGDCLAQGETVVLTRAPKTVRVFLSRGADEDPDSTASNEPAGEVIIRLDYIDMVPNRELVETRQANAGSLCAVMMIPNTTSYEYHFRATRNDIARQWTAALRWVATGCSLDSYCQNFDREGLPVERFSKRELRRLERNISLVDLPFSRISLLLKYLYETRVMGSHKPTMRRTLYTVFNLETFAWTADPASREHKASLKANGRASGVYLNELRGINFYKCLERLALLHYGKERCLNYEAQMSEYNIELKQASVLVLSAWMSWWVFNRTKTVQGQPWPWAAAWKRYPNAYATARQGVLACRLRTLKTLLQEIDKRKPELADVVLQARETAMRKAYKTRKAAKAVKQNRKELRALFKILDLDGDGTLDADEFKDAMGRLSDADGAELDSVLGQLVASEDVEIDEDIFVSALSGFADAARKDPAHWIWKLQVPSGASDGEAVVALTRGSNKLLQDAKKSKQLSELRSVFRSIDTDGNGTLDEDEFREAMGRLSPAEAADFDSVLGDLVAGDTEISEDLFVEALSAEADAARNDTNHWVWRLALNEDDLDEDLDEFDGDLDALDDEYLPQVAE